MKIYTNKIMKFSRWMYSQINMYMKLKLIKQEKRFWYLVYRMY